MARQTRRESQREPRDTVEGRHPVMEALRAGVPLREIVVAEGSEEDRALAGILALARERQVRIRKAARSELDDLSVRGAHQGIVALGEPFRYADLAGVLRSADGRERSLVVVLDHVTDPGNLGAVIRSAEVAGADAVVVPKARAAGVTPAAFKASAGAAAHLPVARVPNIAAALRALKESSYWVAGASERAGTDLWSTPLEGRLALVLGAEGEGLSRLTERECDMLVRIPVAGRVSSLNVAQAATVLSFEWVRRGAGGR